MAQAILLLGGNMGDTRAKLLRAAELLEESGVVVKSRSTTRESEPWGFGSAETQRFVNQAFLVETELSAEELLCATQRAEITLGRRRDEEQEEKFARGERYASRRIDIDIIFYEDLRMQSECLTLPHPLMQEREFVLRPIVEIAAAWRHPELGRSCEELLEELISRDSGL